MRKLKQYILFAFLIGSSAFVYSQDSVNVYPNPTVGPGTCMFYLNKQDTMSIVIFNLLGEVEKQVMLDSVMTIGYHYIPFDLTTSKNGVYLMKIQGWSSKAVARKIIKNQTSLIQDISKTSDILIYPNPACVVVSIKITSPTYSNLKITICDITGKQVYDYITNGTAPIKINLDSFDDGVYTVLIPDLNYKSKLILIR
jgi:hypothetical protein